MAYRCIERHPPQQSGGFTCFYCVSSYAARTARTEDGGPRLVGNDSRYMVIDDSTEAIVPSEFPRPAMHAEEVLNLSEECLRHVAHEFYSNEDYISSKGLRVIDEFTRPHSKLYVCQKKKTEGDGDTANAVADGTTCVIKCQLMDYVGLRPEIVYGRACTEMRCMYQLKMLIQTKRIGPFFSCIYDHGVFTNISEGRVILAVHMNENCCSLKAWLRQPDDAAKAEAVTHYSSDFSEDSTALNFCACAGHEMLVSPNKNAVAFANGVLKSMFLQVCLGLAQAQAYMRFSHNDLHAENVMLSMPDITKQRVYRSGFGEFVVQKNLPTAVIIDTQLSSCDMLDGSGKYQGRIQGYPDSYLNGDGIWYDLFRLSSNLLLDSLRERDVWKQVDMDLRRFMCQCARVPATHASADMPAPVIPCDSQINAHLAHGIHPRMALEDEIFIKFRQPGPYATPGDVFWNEEPDDGYDNAPADLRYMTSAITRWRCGECVLSGAIVGTRSGQRPDLDMFASRLPEQGSLCGHTVSVIHVTQSVLQQGGGAVARDAIGDMLSRMTRYGGDAFEKSRYGWMELERFQRAAKMCYALIIDKPSWLERVTSTDLFMLYDACQVCVRQRFDWIGRHETAANHVRRYLGMPEVIRCMTQYSECTLPCHYITMEYIQEVANTNRTHIYGELIKLSATYSTFEQPPFAAYKQHMDDLIKGAALP